LSTRLVFAVQPFRAAKYAAMSKTIRPMKTVAHIAFYAFALTAMTWHSALADTTIVIVRHAEKPAQGLGQLTCRGLNRSLALAPLLLSRYGHPTAIYAPNPAQLKMDSGVAYAYIRPLATIEPLAIRASRPVNLQWGMTEIEGLAARILSSPPGTQVVAWEHHWGESLATLLLSRLGGSRNDVPTWDDADFDSVYVIRASPGEKGASRVSFSHEQQGLDGLPDTCSDGAPPARP
jgi:hypothetical protein